MRRTESSVGASHDAPLECEDLTLACSESSHELKGLCAAALLEPAQLRGQRSQDAVVAELLGVGRPAAWWRHLLLLCAEVLHP
jgi:hypothetical protein